MNLIMNHPQRVLRAWVAVNNSRFDFSLGQLGVPGQVPLFIDTLISDSVVDGVAKFCFIRYLRQIEKNRVPLYEQDAQVARNGSGYDIVSSKLALGVWKGF